MKSLLRRGWKQLGRPWRRWHKTRFSQRLRSTKLWKFSNRQDFGLPIGWKAIIWLVAALGMPFAVVGIAKWWSLFSARPTAASFISPQSGQPMPLSNNVVKYQVANLNDEWSSWIVVRTPDGKVWPQSSPQECAGNTCKVFGVTLGDTSDAGRTFYIGIAEADGRGAALLQTHVGKALPATTLFSKDVVYLRWLPVVRLVEAKPRSG